MMSRYRSGLALSLILLALPSAPAQAHAQTARPDRALSVMALSNRPDLISGGDARIGVYGSDRALSGLRVELDGRDITPVFIIGPGGAEGLVDGLRDGPNRLRVTSAAGASETLTLINHPLRGPVISGPQATPWVCATPQARPETGDTPAAFESGLASATSGSGCDAPPVYRLFYRTDLDCSARPADARPCFLPFDPSAPRPPDMTTLRAGKGGEMDYVVRVERGAINRGLYDLAVLYDTRTDRPAWNGALVWTFGGSSGNFRAQTPPNSSWMNDDALRAGFLSVVSNFTDGSRNSNRVLAAETVMMLREYVGDHYGRVRHVIGEGCSAGSMQQMVIASMYPGLIDGAIVSCAFPDSDANSMEVVDAFLLGHYFDGEAFARLTHGLSPEEVERKRAAIAGHKDGGTVRAWSRGFRDQYRPGLRGEPAVNNCGLPNDGIYDRLRRPNGLRCSTADGSINIWGAYPDTHTARLFRDNVGIQYGLEALLSGEITGEEFVVLNAEIGGLDHDADFVSERMQGDADAIRIAYQDGLVSDPHQLISTPIIDLRGDENSSVHSIWSSFALRARLQKVDPELGSYAMWRVGVPGAGTWVDPAWRATGLPERALLTMERWLVATEADTGPGSRHDRLARSRPADAGSFCYLGTDYEHRVTDEATCERDPGLKSYSSIRRTAGGPLTSDILKCALRPLNRADYADRLSDDQWDRLRAVFNTGVCDWDLPGVEQQPSTPWRSFADGPGGRPMNPASEAGR